MINIKKIASLIIAVLLIFTQAVIPAFASDAQADVDETKEIFNSSSASSTKEIFKNTYATLTNKVVESNDQSLELTGTGTNADESRNPTFSTAQDWSDYSFINFRVKNGTDGTGMFLFYATVKGANANGASGYWTSSTIRVTGSEWHTLSIAIPDEFTFQHNASTPTVYTEMSHIEGLRFDYIKGLIYIEKIWLSKTKPEPTVLIGSSVPNGYDEVRVDSASFEFNYSQELAPIGKQNADISFTSESGDEVEFVADYYQNLLMITPMNTLEYNTPYSISVSGVKDYNGFGVADTTILNFTTVEKGVSVSEPILFNGDGEILFEMPSDGTILASVEAENLTEASADATLVLACYDSNGKMILSETDIQSVSLEPSQKEPITAQITSSDYTDKTVCTFVIDTIDTRNLLTPIYASLPATSTDEAGNVLSGVSNELTAKFFDFANDTASLEASLNGGMKRTLLMSILSGDTVLHMSPLHNTSDGNVRVDYKLTSSDVSGNYTIELKGRKITNSLSEDFYHLSQFDKQTVFDTANSLSNAADGVALLNDYKEVFQLDDSVVEDDILMHMTAEALSYNKPYNDFEAVKSFVKKAVPVCEELNSQSWDTLGSYVINNESILIGKYDISDFKDLSETKQNKVCNTIKPLKFTSLKDLYDKLSDATDDYMESLEEDKGNKKPSSGRGGGGGGYSVTAPVEVVPPAEDTPAPVVPVVPVTPAPEAFEFDDLADFSWASESIGNLLEKGVISKSSDAKYRPADNITRAEFVKLVVCALYDVTEAADSEFTDVSKDDWCHSYIAIAAKHGLINGREDGTFGKNDNITRQEMAAVIHRAILDLNLNLASGLSEYSYSDDALIADYAKDAVYALYHTGIMTGMEDGSFAPSENANRAQSACVIDRIMKGADHE